MIPIQHLLPALREVRNIRRTFDAVVGLTGLSLVLRRLLWPGHWLELLGCAPVLCIALLALYRCWRPRRADGTVAAHSLAERLKSLSRGAARGAVLVAIASPGVCLVLEPLIPTARATPWFGGPLAVVWGTVALVAELLRRSLWHEHRWFIGFGLEALRVSLLLTGMALTTHLPGTTVLTVLGWCAAGLESLRLGSLLAPLALAGMTPRRAHGDGARPPHASSPGTVGPQGA